MIKRVIKEGLFFDRDDLLEMSRLMKEKGITWQELATLLDISQPTFKKICFGEKDISSEQVEKLENALGIKFVEREKKYDREF